MFPFIQNLRRRWQEPSIYAVLVEGEGITVMHLGIHYSLDEAFKEARKELKKRKPELQSSEFSLWTSAPLKDVVSKYMVTPGESDSASFDSRVTEAEKPKEEAVIAPPPDAGVDRNSLIQALIYFKDISALSEPFANNLTEHERKYVLSKLTEKEAAVVK